MYARAGSVLKYLSALELAALRRRVSAPLQLKDAAERFAWERASIEASGRGSRSLYKRFWGSVPVRG